MKSDSATNAVRPVTSSTACASRQLYTKYSVFWLAQKLVSIMMFREFPPFVGALDVISSAGPFVYFSGGRVVADLPSVPPQHHVPSTGSFIVMTFQVMLALLQQYCIFFFLRQFCVFSFIQEFNNKKNLYEVVFSFLQEFCFLFSFLQVLFSFY